MLFSCKGRRSADEINPETLITQQSDTLTVIYSKNGKTDYQFKTPLMERYELARDPYMEFRYGVDIITFDSLGGEESSLVADYAIFYEKRELWEGRGNVVASGSGRTLFTQQLFWDQKTDKIYSNVDSKVEEQDGSEFVGEGFESDSKFEQWTFRESEGRMWVDTSVNDRESDDQNPNADEPKAEAATAAPKKAESDTRADGVTPAKANKRGSTLPTPRLKEPHSDMELEPRQKSKRE